MDASHEETNRLARQVWSLLDPVRRRALYVHYLDVHAHASDAEHDGMSAYQFRAERTDRSMGELVELVGEDAIVVVLADHAESFGLHGRMGHSSTIYEEVMHVPLYLRVPGIPPAVISDVTSLLAIAPTVAALAGASDLPETGPYLCVTPDHCRDMDAPMALERRAIHLHGLVTGRFQIIRDATTNTVRVYDLVADPNQMNPSASSDVARRLMQWEQRGMHPAQPAVAFAWE